MPAIHCHRAWQRLKERQQKGAFIVLTAFLLPLLIALSGTVIDFGNLYIHKARLQNATDAAAIAGAYAYLDYGDKAAGDTAKSYIMGDSGNLPKDTILTYEKYSAITEDGNTLYCVQLKESVPLYFLKYFLGPSQEIKAVSAASITHNDEPDTPPSEPDQPNKNNPFKNLFTFVDYLDLKNCVHQEAQNKNMQIFTSFDGTIAYTQNTSKVYSYGGSDDQKFYPSDTLGRHQGKDYDAVLKKGVGSEAQLSLDVYSYAKKIEEANKKRKDNDNDKAKNGDQYHIKLNSDQINQDSYYFTGTQGGTLQETILQMNKNST
ncbi:MAG: pilus assembly protein [Selenomonadaceae bacterium]|nr:pilus assembly protein [Selenomonadaceae bacterium]